MRAGVERIRCDPPTAPGPRGYSRRASRSSTRISRVARMVQTTHETVWFNPASGNPRLLQGPHACVARVGSQGRRPARDPARSVLGAWRFCLRGPYGFSWRTGESPVLLRVVFPRAALSERVLQAFLRARSDWVCLHSNCTPSENPMKSMERVKGIEPSSQAWEARILPLNHTRCPLVSLSSRSAGGAQEIICSPAALLLSWSPRKACVGVASNCLLAELFRAVPGWRWRRRL